MSALTRTDGNLTGFIDDVPTNHYIKINLEGKCRVVKYLAEAPNFSQTN
jgi:hypothetical protein